MGKQSLYFLCHLLKLKQRNIDLKSMDANAVIKILVVTDSWKEVNLALQGKNSPHNCMNLMGFLKKKNFCKYNTSF